MLYKILIVTYEHGLERVISMENISYWQEVHEFKIQLKKVIIPFEKFFKSNENKINNTQNIDVLSSEIET